MMIDVLFVEEQVIFATTDLMHSVLAVVNLATLHRTAPTRFLPQKHHATKTDFIQSIDMPTPEGMDDTPPIMVPDMGDISANHNPVTTPTMTGTAVSEGTHCTPHPATAEVYSTLWLMDAPIAIHAMLHPTMIVTPHPTLTTSPADVTHAIIPQTGTSLSLATPTALHRNHSHEKPGHFQDLQSPNPTVPRLSSSRIPLQTLPLIQTATLIL